MTRHQYHLNLTEYTSLPFPLFSSSPYLLRPPTLTDLPILAALMLDAYIGTIDYDGETLEDAENEVQSYFNGASGEPLLNASRLCFDGEALASATLISLWQGNPLVAYVMTAAAYKGQGLGHALLHQSLVSLKRQGYSEVRAVITKGNLPSETIFKKIGFELQGNKPMLKQDYEYRDLMAKSWDLLRGDTSNWPDRFFFRHHIQTYGQPALDVGCGTGRILLDYLSYGIDIDGVDNSPEMLVLCQEKAAKLGLHPNLYQQEMQELALPRQYRTILVPSSSFQLVLDPKDATLAMSRFFDHLLSGGVLIMPFGFEWKEGDPLKRDAILLQQATDPETGLTYHRWSSDWFDPENQLEHTENRYDALKDGEIIASETHVRSPATRWYTRQQAVQLYVDAGFTNIQIFHEFELTPAQPDDNLFCILGIKP